MKWLAVMLALGACNQVFGLAPTTALPPIDAQQFDAPADAPYACPPLGQQPTFSAFFHQIISTGDCVGYSLSAPAMDLAIAMCVDSIAGAMSVRVNQGPIDMSLGDTQLISSGGPFDYASAVVAPEGDQLWVNRNGGGTSTISVYDRTAPNSWTWVYDAYTLPVAEAAASLGPPTRAGPNRRILYAAGNVHELREISPGTWSEVHSYKPIALGMGVIRDVSLSADGLRMVVSGVTSGPGPGYPAMMYAARASVTDLFSGGGWIDGAPGAGQSPFMTEDCGRLYFSGLGSVFYVNQR